IKKDKKQLVICGGSGICSIYALLKELKKKHVDTTCIVGFKTKKEVVLEKELKTLCNKLIVCTDDGTYGFKGNVVDAIKHYHLSELYYYCCGSTPLMRAVLKTCKHGQLSLEARMGCGFGACMGCSIKTKHGNKRICKDGVIFNAEDLYEI
ncbi:MAG: dihydroorotate dehydrogenase electron transfer subunit, partial [Malacoplasma sp.]|nr:dihydroorotate dehydrogenase electron transfer subunit [Malacoplasma sp.]